MNWSLDARLSALATRLGARYSRYADDLKFSLGADDRRAVLAILRAAPRIARAEGYRVHARRKLHVRRRHQRQLVAGLVVNEIVQLPRETRRWLRAVEHAQRARRPSTLTSAQLEGWRCLQRMIEAQRAPPGGGVAHQLV